MFQMVPGIPACRGAGTSIRGLTCSLLVNRAGDRIHFAKIKLGILRAELHRFVGLDRDDGHIGIVPAVMPGMVLNGVGACHGQRSCRAATKLSIAES